MGLRCSLHRTEIGLLERGARVPRIDTLVKIASGLGVRIDCALLDGIDWTPATTEAGAFTIMSRSEKHAELMERAAVSRGQQAGVGDAAELVREAPEEMGRRGMRSEG